MLKNINFKYLKQKNLYFWLVFLVLILIFSWSHFLDSDEGAVLAGAWRLINKQKIYIDFFEFIPPASFYLIFWTWKIFGLSYWTAKIISALSVFISSIGAYKIGSLIKKEKTNFLIPVVFTIPILGLPLISYHTFNLVFSVWSVYFFLKALENQCPKIFFVSGMFNGLGATFFHPASLALLAGQILYLLLTVKKQIKIAIKSISSYSAGFLLPIIALFLKWSPILLFDNIILFPLLNYSKTIHSSYKVFFILLSLLFFVTLNFIIKKQNNKKIWALILLQFFLLLSTVSYPSVGHLAFVIFPLTILIILFWSSFFKVSSRLSFFISSLIVINTLGTYFLFRPFLNSLIFAPPLLTDINNNPIINYLKTNCQYSPYLYAGPFLPGLYFETKKINPTAYDWLITNHHTKEQFQKAAQALAQNPPDCIVLNYKMVKKYHYNKNNPVDNFILTNYQPVFKLRNSQIYKKIKKNKKP